MSDVNTRDVNTPGSAAPGSTAPGSTVATGGFVTTEEPGVLRMEPEPEFISADDFTLGVFTKGCELLELDADRILAGEVDTLDKPMPPLKNCQLFVQLVLTNGHAYDLEAMHPSQARAFMGLLTGHFIASSVVT